MNFNVHCMYNVHYNVHSNVHTPYRVFLLKLRNISPTLLSTLSMFMYCTCTLLHIHTIFSKFWRDFFEFGY